MEELARAVDALVEFLFVQGWTVAGKLADIGECVEQTEFGIDQLKLVAGQAAAKSIVFREQNACPFGAHVVTADQTTKLAQTREGLTPRGHGPAFRLRPEMNSRRGMGRRGFADLVETQQCGARIDLIVDRGKHFANT